MTVEPAIFFLKKVPFTLTFCSTDTRTLTFSEFLPGTVLQLHAFLGKKSEKANVLVHCLCCKFTDFSEFLPRFLGDHQHRCAGADPLPKDSNAAFGASPTGRRERQRVGEGYRQVCCHGKGLGFRVSGLGFRTVTESG